MTYPLSKSDTTTLTPCGSVVYKSNNPPSDSILMVQVVPFIGLNKSLPSWFMITGLSDNVSSYSDSPPSDVYISRR
ncbi:MAG: hypothetical protein J6T10_15390 [Methanobrevibacter sp.]|nr:hypothetical protein [Methanobrevibacter sp.]